MSENMQNSEGRKSTGGGSSSRPGRDSTPEMWMQRGMIVLVAIWLLVTVVFPLFQVLDHAINTELPAAIYGPDDIRIAGHRANTENGAYFIDGKQVQLVNGVAENEVMKITSFRDGMRVSCNEIILNGGKHSVEPITAEARGDVYIIEGKRLPPDEWRKTVKRFTGLSNFAAYFSNKNLYLSFINSLKVSFISTIMAVLLAFCYAYGITRTAIPFKPFFRLVAMLPLFAPTMLYGLSLVYIFGNKGLITTGLFGHLPWLATKIHLYGAVGIVISEVIFSFPPAMMILMVALSNTDARLYDAAASLGFNSLKTFKNVTLPSVKFGLMSAVFVCFTLAFTDFGAPKVVGGNFNVLAVDIYKHVIGQQNFGMGATVSIILLLPTMVAFIADRIIQRRQAATMSANSMPLRPKRNIAVDGAMFAVCGLIAFILIAMLFTAGYASLVKLWPYHFNLGFWHYNFKGYGGGGYNSFWNSVRIAGITALIGAPLIFVSAYLIEKSKGMNALRSAAYFLSILPLALPGLVIGIAYIFFFNKVSFSIPFTSFEVPNIFNGLYGTVAIIIISNITHFYTVNFLTATTALRQLDKEFETVAESLSVPFYKTFFRVTVPVCLPAILEMTMFLFISSMATVSAVIFLYSPDTPLASVAVINMDDAGDTIQASAMCMLIVGANIAVRIVFETVNYFVRKTGKSWRG